MHHRATFDPIHSEHPGNPMNQQIKIDVVPAKKWI